MFHVKPSIVLNKLSPAYKVDKWKKIKEWLIFVAQTEGCQILSLSYTLLADKELLKLNKNHLSHNTYTDIITFDLGEKKNLIEGDIYISYDRVKENSKTFDARIQDELKRVMVHGLLHLLGYLDKTEREIKEIRNKETHYLNIYNKKFHVEQK
jgi:probable rRNA maturation factor